MELFPEEIKLLVLNLQKKKEEVKDEVEKKTYEVRIKELTDILKNKKQKELNNSFNTTYDLLNNLKTTLESFKDKIEDDSYYDKQVYTDLGDHHVLIDRMKELESLPIKDIILGVETCINNFENIVDYQKEIQQVENPVDMFFDFLIVPIKKNNPVQQVSANIQPIQNNVLPIQNNLNQTISEEIIQVPQQVLPKEVILKSNPKQPVQFIDEDFDDDFGDLEFDALNSHHKITPSQQPQNNNFIPPPQPRILPENLNYLRNKVINYVNNGNYEQVYMLLKDANMNLKTVGFEDILNEEALEGGTVMDQIKNIMPITTNFNVVEDNSETEIHYSSKAQELLSGSKANQFKSKFINKLS